MKERGRKGAREVREGWKDGGREGDKRKASNFALIHVSPLPLYMSGGGDEAVDVDPFLGWQDPSASHHETETTVDWEADLLSRHPQQHQLHPNTLHPS